MKKYFNGLYLPAMLGACIEYYDIALYAYMAPILVQIFFPFLEITTSYFFYFLFEFIAAVFQFFGAKIFGSLGDRYGRKPAMYNSILGISIVTFTICLLPTYEQIGIMATFLFCISRILQRFFLGGEYNGGAIYCLEHESDITQHGLLSSLYGTFTVLGIILAGIVTFICNKMGPEFFRAAYGFSFLLTFIIFKLRASIKETPIYLNAKQREPFESENLSQKPILNIVIASLFFGLIYGIPTKVFNALLPLSFKINRNEIMLLNLITLFLYGSFLFFAGVLSRKYSNQKLMLVTALSACVLSYPLIFILSFGSWAAIFFVKIMFIMIAAFFIAPFHAWAQTLSCPNTRYTTISTSCTIGKCMANLTMSLIFVIYEYFNEIKILGILLSFFSLITVRSLYKTYFDKKTQASICT